MSMTTEATVLALLRQVYDAAHNPDLWPGFLAAMSETFEGQSTSLIFHDLTTHVGGIAWSARTDPEALALYQQHYHALDPWGNATGGERAFRPGWSFLDEELVPRRELLHGAFYNEFGKRFGVVQMIGTLLRREGAAVSVIAITRPDRTHPFGEAERALMQILTPHLQRALQLHRRMTNLAQQREASFDVMEGLPTGVVVLDSRGESLFSNRLARQFAQACDGFGFDGLKLTGVNGEHTRALRALIARAAQTAAGEGTDAGGAMSLPRSSLKRPYQVLVSPLGRGIADDESDPVPAVIVFISDPERGPEIDTEALRHLYALTPAEALLVRRLTEGHSLEAAARHQRIATSTARTQLKRAMAKMGVHTQAELTHAVLTSAAVLPLI